MDNSIYYLHPSKGLEGVISKCNKIKVNAYK